MRELGRVFSEDFEAESPQLFLGYGQPHIKDLKHLEFHLSNIPATEDAGDIRPFTVGVGKIEGILERQTRMRKGRSVIVDSRERKNVANRGGEDQRPEEQPVQDPVQRRDIHVNLRPPQVEQRDDDRGGVCPASPDDIPDEPIEATILAVHPVRQGKEIQAHCFGRTGVESMSSHVRGGVNDVICDRDVSRRHK